MKAEDVLPNDKLLISKRKSMTNPVLGVAHWKEVWTVVDTSIQENTVTLSVTDNEDGFDVFEFPHKQELEIVRKNDTADA